MPDHVHAIDYGVYQGPQATSYTMQIDGGTTIAVSTSITDFDIVPYLAKSSSGRINRGWHELVLRPTDLSMIDVQLMVQTFINSRGGGNF
jgi:hypothetical protein